MILARKENILLGIILLVGAVLRFYKLGEFSLTNDELSALYRLEHNDLQSLWKVGVMETDFHPAGVQTFLWFWTKLVGTGTFMVRLPFALCGLFSIWLTYMLGKRWGNATVGLIAAAFIASLAFPVLYSRLARPYSPGLLFTLGALWFWSGLVSRNEGAVQVKDIVGLALMGALCAYTHYYSALMIVVIGITGLFLIGKQKLPKYIAAGALMLISFLPHWGITQAHMAVGGVGGAEGWLDPPGDGWLHEHFDFVFNCLWIALVMIITGIIIRVFGEKMKWSITILGAIWYTVLLSFGFWYSHSVNPILQHSAMLFAFPTLLLALAWWVTPTKQHALQWVVPAGILLVGSITTAAIADPFGNEQFGEFKAIATTLEAWEDEYGKQNITSAYAFNNLKYLEHYLNEPVRPTDPVVKGKEQLPDLMRQLSSSTTPYFSFSWSTTTTPHELYALIRRYYPNIADEHNWFNSGATLFHRERGASAEYHRAFSYERQSEKWVVEDKASNHFKVPQGTEFFGNAQWRVGDLTRGMDDGPYITAQLDIDSLPPSADIVLVFEWERREKRYLWRGSSLNLFPIPINGARTIMLTDQLPKDARSTDTIKVYCWNKKKGGLHVKSLELRVHQHP